MALLVDTSAWIEHFRSPDPAIVDALDADEAFVHELVIGELAAGRIPSRGETLRDLGMLPRATTVPFGEVLQFIDLHRLWGKGLGWIDLCLLSSARVDAHKIHSRDRRLMNTWYALRPKAVGRPDV
jgi:predicted nucleic acid-binding protein